MALSTISGTTGITDATVTSAKLADFTAAVDLNGVELLLDADQDTSISADTDDRIDFKIANVEHFSFSNSSGDTVVKPMVDAKDIIFQQYDGNKVFEINDSNYVGVGGNATAAGAIRIYEDTDNGSHYSGFTVGNLTASVTYALPNADGSSGQVLSTDGSGVLSWATASANTPTSADGQALGSASLEWSDLFLADAGTIQLGNDQDVTLTHVADTGILINSTRKIQFGDSASFVHQSADGTLTIDGEAIIDLNASTRVDVSTDLKVGDDINLASDSAAITFGADSEITLIHVADNGLILKHAATGDDKFPTLTLQTGDTDIAANDKLGALNFQAPDEGAGTDAILVAAGIEAISEGDFSASANATKLIFKTAASAAAAETMALSSAGNLSISGTFAPSGIVTADAGVVVDNITIDGTEIDLSSGDLLLDVAGDINLDADGGDIVFKDGGTSILTMTNSSTDFVMTVATQDKDFVIKGDDGGSAITPFTLDMSAGGDLFLTGGLIDLKNDGSAVSQIKFYCESSNAHAQTLIGAPHSESATNTLTLPSTGGNSYLLTAASTATLTNKTLTTPRIVDNGYIQFGTDNEVRLISNPDKGVILKHTATADDKPSILTLQTGETDIAANDVIGAVDFQAPDEATGTDAILVAAGIEAVSEGDFSSSANATSLVFKTGASEAAAGKIKVTSAGHLFPMADDSYDLGGASNQWRNIYTGDLHLSNMSKDIGNIVDGSKGDWTIQEGSSDLFLINNNSGKKYKFNLTEV